MITFLIVGFAPVMSNISSPANISSITVDLVLDGGVSVEICRCRLDLRAEAKSVGVEVSLRIRVSNTDKHISTHIHKFTYAYKQPNNQITK